MPHWCGGTTTTDESSLARFRSCAAEAGYVLSLVAAQPTELDSSDRRLDFGHDDVFRAKSAVALVWEAHPQTPAMISACFCAASWQAVWRKASLLVLNGTSTMIAPFTDRSAGCTWVSCCRA